MIRAEASRRGAARHSARIRRRAALASGLVALVAAGCGGGDSEETGSASTAATDRVEIIDFGYEPASITVAAGTDVRWTNADRAPHTATAEDGSFDTGTLKLADEGKLTLDEPGTYAYYCRFHAFMKATVEVE